MKPSPQNVVYVLGVVALGLLYEPAKSALGGKWLFLSSVVCYLLVLRVLGALVAKALESRRRGRDA